MHLHVLASGSAGNCSIVDNDGRLLMIDCGICRREVLSRCDELGIDVNAIEAILVTHEHTDHTSGLGVFHREMAKRGIVEPIVTGAAVMDASKAIGLLRDTTELRYLRADEPLSLAGMTVLPFHTSHDAAESFGFRFQTDDDAIGFMTDTGTVPPAAHEALGDVRILAIEGNHDLSMLHDGDYPASLKRRIEGDFGHLSNDQCTDEVESLLSNRLQQVVAMHISENNNTFGRPVRSLRAMLERCDHPCEVSAGRPRTPETLR